MKEVKRVALLFISLLFCFSVVAQHINHAGYVGGSVKRAFLPKEFEKTDFMIENEKGQQVFTGNTSSANYWECSGTSVCVADFSSIRKEGKYTLQVKGVKPISFEVNDDFYSKLGKDVVKMFYHARMSMPIEEKYAGKYARPAGHPDDEVIIHASAASAERPEGSIISSPGGWYDAGDYNKYIVNSAISTFSLLHAVELYDENIKNVDLNIPESGNATPDILDETLYNLKWMLSMQDQNDGGVYHKLTTKKFCGMVMPHEDKNPRYVVMKTTAAALDFAATMAKAYRVLQDYGTDYMGLAEQCIKVAECAWEWSLANGDVLYKQPDDIKTGKYGDRNLSDEWLWAASELYLATNNKTYLDKIDLAATKFEVPSWGRVATLALYSIVNAKTDNKELVELAKKELLQLTDKQYSNYKESAFQVSITKFPWGSNGALSNQGMLFLNAYKLNGDRSYLEAADACLGYILGANPSNYCFVSGHGKKSPMRVHERRSESDGITEPVPGFLIGGASLSAQHDCGKEKYPSEFPALSYIDELCSYSTNEIAINWNAAFAYLVWGLDTEMGE